MNSNKGNSLIVIENGKLNTYSLDNRLKWSVGRGSKDNVPDILFHSPTVSRKHGLFKNIDGIWFYYDENGKNGTVYNGKHLTTGINGRIKPIMLNKKDVLIFGGGNEAVINEKTVWTLYYDRVLDAPWRIEDTKSIMQVVFTDGDETTKLVSPCKGTVIDLPDGMAIYMGDVTYITGNMKVKGV